VHPFWYRLHAAVALGRLSPRDIATWFDIPYMTAWTWINVQRTSKRGPWFVVQYEQKLGLLERAIAQGRLPLKASAKNRKDVIGKLADELDRKVLASHPAE